MTTEHSHYQAYLLRLWQTGSGKESTWRASLEDAHTGERHSFASIEDLSAFLGKQTGRGASISEGEEMSL